jgi:Pro-kumamolisin, activation domain/Bacterial Ig-like domain (group 3)
MSTNRNGISRLSVAALALALGLTALAAHGQTAAQAAPRVLSSVDTAQMVTLRGNTHPLAQSRFDQGAVDDATPTGRMMLVLKRSDEQQTALHQLLDAQQDPNSSSYHKWLTPESFGAQFGVADADIQAVTAYLSAEGFTVSRVFPNKMAVEFFGTTGQIRSTFQTEIHTYAANGQTFQANASDPKIPAALAQVVTGIASLNNYRTPPHSSALSQLLRKPSSGANPLYTTGTNGNDFEAISPGDLAVIYNITTGATGGQGVTVGVVNDSNINLQIPANYRTVFGLAANVPNVIVDGNDPGIVPGDDLFGYEQVELISAVAPAAAVNYYVSSSVANIDTGLHFAALRAILDNTVQVLVFPFESCEANLGTVYNALFSALWEEASAQGISVIVPSGSGGAEECDAEPVGSQVALATHGLAVNGYASSAYDTAVGATDFYYAGDVANFLLDFNIFSGTSSYTSAAHYIPEQPSNSSNQGTNLRQGPNVVAASGGGVSTLGQAVATPIGVPPSPGGPHLQPAYQAGVVPASIAGTPAARVIPDISMFGGNAANNLSSYILCVDPTDCAAGSSPGNLVFTSSTDLSTSAGVFAGVAALIVQSKGVQGNLNPSLYATYRNSRTGFNDITAGTNEVHCQGGTANCAGAGTGLTTGYVAGTGYDAASGLGSANVGNLISSWTTPKAALTITASLTRGNNNAPVKFPIVHGTPVQLNVTITASSGVPTGDVAITTSSPQTPSHGLELLPLSSGTTRTIPGNGRTTVTLTDGNFSILPGGSYNVIARYGGDSTFGAQTAAPIPVTVSGVTSTINILTQSFNPGGSLTYGSPAQFTLEVDNATNNNDFGIATGSITINDSGKQSTILPLNSLGNVTFSSSSLDAGFHTFTATYSGDNSYSASSISGGFLTVTVNPAPSTTVVHSSDTTLSSHNGTVTLSATVTGPANNAGRVPRGNVQFLVNGTATGSPVALDTGTTAGVPAATAVFRPGANVFLTNPSVVTATYIPDTTGDYLASTSAPFNIASAGTGGLSSTTTTVATTPTGLVNIANSSTLALTSTVTSPGRLSNNDTVSFYADGTLLGTSNLNNGVATLSIAGQSLPVGLSNIIAEYNGDATNAASSSPNYQLNVYGRGTTPDFALQANQTYGILSPTVSSVTFRLQLTALDGAGLLHDPVGLTVTSPSGLSCAPNATSVDFGGNTYTNATVTCTAASGSTIGSLTAPSRPLLWMAEGGAALACVFLFGMPTRRRSWQATLGALALIVVAFGVTGCAANLNPSASTASGRSSASGTPGAQAAAVVAPGTYTVVVTGTENVLTSSPTGTTVAVVHTLPLSIVVQ